MYTRQELKEKYINHNFFSHIYFVITKKLTNTLPRSEAT